MQVKEPQPSSQCAAEGPSLLWYGGFPIGFHNPESERKALAFASHGYRVTYTEGVGLRDPRLRHARKVVEIVLARLGTRKRRSETTSDGVLTNTGFFVCPPRRLRALRHLNSSLLLAQLRRAVPDLQAGVAWVRYPSPELVDAIAVVRPRVIVYECLDAMDQTPGTTGVWRRDFLTAERRLADLADAVVVPSEGLGARFEDWRSKLHVIGHGVDVSPWRPPPGNHVTGFVGTLDYRLDLDVIERVAALPGWRVRLVGPVSEGFDVRRVQRMAAVSLEAPVPHEQVADLLASFDVGIMPYADGLMFRGMTPIKNLELLGVGRPAVSRRSPALLPFSEIIAFADTPGEFAASVERMAAEDDEQRARRRLEVAEQFTWPRQLHRLVGLVDDLLDRRQ